MASLPVVVRSAEVPAKSNYQEYKPYLRVDFWYSCAYCTMTEVECNAIGFCIDHYEPVVKEPTLKNNYANCMWCCDVCNDRKSDISPSPNLRAKGYVIFRPDQHNPDDNFSLKNLRVEGTTEIGEYTIQCVDLNRLQLRRMRDIRSRVHKSYNVVLGGLRALHGIPLDRFPPTIRANVIKLKSDLQNQGQTMAHVLDDLLRRISRSSLLDSDPDQKERTKSRREHLKRLEALATPLEVEQIKPSTARGHFIPV